LPGEPGEGTPTEAQLGSGTAPPVEAEEVPQGETPREKIIRADAIYTQLNELLRQRPDLPQTEIVNTINSLLAQTPAPGLFANLREATSAMRSDALRQNTSEASSILDKTISTLEFALKVFQQEVAAQKQTSPAPPAPTVPERKDEGETRTEYVSIGGIIDKVHEMGGKTSEIIPAETAERMNSLQSHVSEWSNDLSQDEWNELMQLKTEVKSILETWVEQHKPPQKQSETAPPPPPPQEAPQVETPEQIKARIIDGIEADAKRAALARIRGGMGIWGRVKNFFHGGKDAEKKLNPDRDYKLSEEQVTLIENLVAEGTAQNANEGSLKEVRELARACGITFDANWQIQKTPDAAMGKILAKILPKSVTTFLVAGGAGMAVRTTIRGLVGGVLGAAGGGAVVGGLFGYWRGLEMGREAVFGGEAWYNEVTAQMKTGSPKEIRSAVGKIYRLLGNESERSKYFKNRSQLEIIRLLDLQRKGLESLAIYTMAEAFAEGANEGEITTEDEMREKAAAKYVELCGSSAAADDNMAVEYNAALSRAIGIVKPGLTAEGVLDKQRQGEIEKDYRGRIAAKKKVTGEVAKKAALYGALAGGLAGGAGFLLGHLIADQISGHAAEHAGQQAASETVIHNMSFENINGGPNGGLSLDQMFHPGSEYSDILSDPRCPVPIMHDGIAMYGTDQGAALREAFRYAFDHNMIKMPEAYVGDERFMNHICNLMYFAGHDANPLPGNYDFTSVQLQKVFDNIILNGNGNMGVFNVGDILAKSALDSAAEHGSSWVSELPKWALLAAAGGAMVGLNEADRRLAERLRTTDLGNASQEAKVGEFFAATETNSWDDWLHNKQAAESKETTEKNLEQLNEEKKNLKKKIAGYKEELPSIVREIPRDDTERFLRENVTLENFDEGEEKILGYLNEHEEVVEANPDISEDAHKLCALWLLVLQAEKALADCEAKIAELEGAENDELPDGTGKDPEITLEDETGKNYESKGDWLEDQVREAESQFDGIEFMTPPSVSFANGWERQENSGALTCVIATGRNIIKALKPGALRPEEEYVEELKNLQRQGEFSTQAIVEMADKAGIAYEEYWGKNQAIDIISALREGAVIPIVLGGLHSGHAVLLSGIKGRVGSGLSELKTYVYDPLAPSDQTEPREIALGEVLDQLSYMSESNGKQIVAIKDILIFRGDSDSEDGSVNPPNLEPEPNPGAESETRIAELEKQIEDLRFKLFVPEVLSPEDMENELVKIEEASAGDADKARAEIARTIRLEAQAKKKKEKAKNAQQDAEDIYDAWQQIKVLRQSLEELKKNTG